MNILCCPFCGATDVEIGEPEPKQIAIDCPDCGCMGPYGKTAEEAIDLWNIPARPSKAEPAALDCAECGGDPDKCDIHDCGDAHKTEPAALAPVWTCEWCGTAYKSSDEYIKCKCGKGNTAALAGIEQQFAEWMRQEMPAGTLIGDPDWWVPRILKAATVERLVQERNGWRNNADDAVKSMQQAMEQLAACQQERDDYRAALEEFAKPDRRGSYQWFRDVAAATLAKHSPEDEIERARRLTG